MYYDVRGVELITVIISETYAKRRRRIDYHDDLPGRRFLSVDLKERRFPRSSKCPVSLK